MLNFEQFQEYVSDHIKEFLPEELQSANVELNSVNKNNGRELHAILVRPEGCSIAPTVYLDGFYESYEDGASLDSVLKDIADTSAKNQSPEEFANIAEDYRNFDFVKDRIVMAVVNAEKNQEMLQETPHKMKEDLAVIYKVMIGADAHGLASITVKQPHMDTWGIDVDQLHDYAMKNSNRLLPATVQSMDEIMRDMMSNSGMDKYVAGTTKTSFAVDAFDNSISGRVRSGDVVNVFAVDPTTENLKLMLSDVYVEQAYDSSGVVVEADGTAVTFTVRVAPDEIEAMNNAIAFGGIHLYLSDK